MKKEFRSIFVVISILAFAFTGCKKTPEELAKEEEIQKKKVVADNVNSVYQLGGNGLAYFVNMENPKSVLETCFEFKPKEGKASVKFYQHPEIYNLEVSMKNELEYMLTYKGKKAYLRLELNGDFPVADGSMQKFYANPILSVPDDKKADGSIGKMDLVYGGVSIRDLHHGRFNTLKECEAQNLADEELSKSLQEQKSTCEGPGCY
ncbi:lipoprotein, tandem type [Leptospira interrogans serovar Szwajizak]|uniref:lipoprotein, tandem type n=1 Tax=Leptospira interrogans TaxID=173 RepID=UPI003CF9063A